MTTHAVLGVAFNTGADSGYNNAITTDIAGNLYLNGGDGGTTNHLWGYTQAGVKFYDKFYPNASGSYRDGLAVVGNTVVTNRGDQQGPYDRYDIANLTYINQPFINTALTPDGNFGWNGIGFNGVNYYAFNEQAHHLWKFDINGNALSFVSLDLGSRYENMSVAQQDIVSAVPEPSSVIVLSAAGLLFVAAVRRRKLNQT